MPNFDHYLRLEGVNLDAFVGDTRQLSVNRGGSLKLLRAVQMVQEKWESELVTVSQGASIGLFGIREGGDAEGLAKLVRDMLNREGFEHGTFVVDVVSAKDGFRPALESAIAANRWQQLQASALSIPALNEEAGDAKGQHLVCSVGWLQPAASDCRGQDNKLLSPSVHARWQFGRGQRQKFYEEVTGLTNPLRFADEFEALASNSTRLEGKMALFYADGNHFGSLQTKHCQSPAYQALWDHVIRSKREAFLTQFLREEVLDKTGRSPWLNAEGEVRFETLLWGGDELMFVMPAELGWRFATRFFEHFGDWNLEGAVLPETSPFAADQPVFPSQSLTHAAALIFCQHHSPIGRLKSLAKEQMAETGKGKSRYCDHLVYLALESFDHVGSGYKKAMSRRYRDQIALHETVLSSSESASLAKQLAKLSGAISTLADPAQDFARSQLRELVVHTLHPTKAVLAPETVTAALKEYFFRAKKESVQAVLELAKIFPNPALWIHLEELWDYALP